MMIMSSLNRIGPAVVYPPSWTAVGLRSHFGPYSISVLASPPSTVITCVGFCRYWNAPCGPDEPKSTPNGKTFPCLTSPAACWTFSAVIRFSVPSSSASPHRPQLRTSSATRRKSSSPAMFHPSPGRNLAEEALRHGTAVHADHLTGDVSRRGTVEEHQHARLLVGGRDTTEGGRERLDELLTERGAK